MHGLILLAGGISVSGRALLGLVALLLIGGIGWLMLEGDKRKRRMAERVAAVAAANAMIATRSLSIRRQSRAQLPMARVLRGIFNIPEARPKVGAAPGWLFFVIGALCGTASSFMLPLYFSPTMVLVGSIGVGLMAVRGLFKWDYDRYAGKLLRQLPDAMQLVMSAVRVGMPVAEALQGVAREMASPTREEFVQVCDEMSLGTNADTAVMGMYRRTGLTEYGIFAITLAVQSRSGGRLAETLQNLAETTRQRVALVARARALAGEARISAIALCVLPFIGAGAVSMLQPGYLNVLLFTHQGQRLLGFGFGSLLIGILTMRMMIKGVEKP